MVSDVHESAIFSLTVLNDGRVLSGGGRDGLVIELSPDLEKTGNQLQVSSPGIFI